MRTDDFCRDEVREGLKMRHHPDPELRRRNRARVRLALGILKRRRDRMKARTAEPAAPPVVFQGETYR